MWSDVINNLGLYGDYILFSAIVMIIFATFSMTLVRFIRWKSITLKWYGIFIGIKPAKLIALSLIMIRMLFFWYLIFTATKPEVPFLCYGILVTVIIHIILADVSIIVFDLLYTILVFGVLYVSSQLHSYLTGIQMKGSIVAMLVVVSIYALINTLYCAVVCINSMSSSNQNKKYKIRKSVIGQHMALLVTGILVTVIPYLFMNSIGSILIRQDLYQYTAEGRIPHTGINKVSKSGNGCVLENNGKIFELQSTPLYYTSESKILVPSVMSIIQPPLLLTNRIGNMSKLYEKENKYYVENEDGTIKVSDFFLYDGRDTYVFFEPITVEWDGQSIDLAPFSFVTVKYNKTVEIFSKKTEQYSTINTGFCNVTTVMNCGASINLSTDILYRENGQEQMLFLQPNLLEDLK